MTVNAYLLEHDDQEIRDSHKYQRLIEIIRIFVRFISSTFISERKLKFIVPRLLSLKD